MLTEYYHLTQSHYHLLLVSRWTSSALW